MADSGKQASARWKELSALQEPFNDAVNYKTRQQKEFFSKIFLRTDDLQECLKPSIYYLIGEKGSGKTAYAAYLENNEVEGTRCRLTTMTETQYKRFIALKRKGRLDYSDYANIWRPMLLNMAAQTLVLKSKGFFASVTGKFDAVETEIERFNQGALNPEVEAAFEMVSESSGSLSLGHEKYAQVAAKGSEKSTEKVEAIKHHLLDKETKLKQAIGDLGLSKNHILFIDGIDYRPEDVPYNDYLACVKGLGEAIWQLNNDFFGNIRDSKGRIKVVLLVRPDVFNRLNLYNSNSRLRDNSVLLDWSTTEAGFHSSRLYEATGKYFSSQQAFDVASEAAADNYLNAEGGDFIFKRLLRATFQKPRDLLTFIRIARNVCIKKLGRASHTSFGSDVIQHPDYTREYSDYLLGEVRDYADFYMPQQDFSLYIKFFQYLHGKGEFTFQEFESAYRSFKNWISGETVVATEYLRDPEALLQFFFDVNIVGYREEMGTDHEKFIHFSFRERTLTNIAPKVKTMATLVVNPGIAKALDIGLRVQRSGGRLESEGRRNRRARRNDQRRGGAPATQHQPTKKSEPSGASRGQVQPAKKTGSIRRKG